MADPSLRTLQNWMQDAVTAPGGVQRGITAAIDRNGLTIGEVVRDSNLLPAEQRVAIYARGYLLRLRECLRAEFPVFHALAGDQVFDLFAGAYVWSHPSASPSLMDLGAGFAEFLRATQPAGTEPGAIETLPANIVALERARSESARETGIERDPSHFLPMTLDSLFQMTERSFRLPPTTRLLRSDFPLTDLVQRVDRGETVLPTPAALETYHAVSRHRYRVIVHELHPWQFAFLDALGKTGTPLHAAIEKAAEHTALSSDTIWGEALIWLPAAYDAALLTPTQS